MPHCNKPGTWQPPSATKSLTLFARQPRLRAGEIGSWKGAMIKVRTGCAWLAMLAIALTVACSAGTETKAEVIARFRPQIEAKREEIRSLFGNIDTSTGAQPVRGAVRPVANNTGARGSTNLAFLPLDSFQNGGPPELDLFLMSPLASALELAADTDFESDYPAESSFIRLFEEAVATPFVSFYAQSGYEEARLTGDSSFEGGRLEVEALIIELETRAIVAKCHVWANPGANLNYAREQNEDLSEVVAQAALVAMRENIRNELSKCFADQTGGAFTL